MRTLAGQLRQYNYTVTLKKWLEVGKKGYGVVASVMKICHILAGSGACC